MSRKAGAVINDYVLCGFSLRLFSLSRRARQCCQACQIFGIHPSTYYRRCLGASIGA
jgi:hypothetical protein